MNVDDLNARNWHSPLGRRYDFDEASHLRLNELQQQVKARLEQHIADGQYRFEAVPCALCDGEAFMPLASRDRYGLLLPLVLCRGCGLVQSNPRMDGESYARFYNDEYRPLYGGSPEPTEDFFGAQRQAGRRVHRFVAGNGGLPLLGRRPFVLEVGCGAGGILHYFRGFGCRVLGIDLGEAYIRYGREHHGLDLRVATLADLGEDVRPDLIIYSHVVEHLLDPVAELARARRMLAPGGAMYVEVPGLRSLWRFYRMDLLGYLQNAHTYHLTRSTLRWLLARAGFDAVACDEWVRGVFRASAGSGATTVPDRADADREIARTLRYLRRAEIVRHVTPAHPASLPEGVRSMTFRTLDAVGLLKVARAARRRFAPPPASR